MDLLQLFPKLKEKSVTLSSLDISHREFLNWKEKGLINYTPEYTNEDIENDVSRKRIELNFFDALWLLMIKELRSFNMGLPSIKKIGQYLFEQIDVSSIKQSSHKTIERLLDNYRPLLSFDIDNNGLEENFMKNKVDILPDEYKIYFTNIGALINSVILVNLSPSLMLYKIPSKSELEPYIYSPFIEEFICKENGTDFKQETIDRLATYSILNIPIRPLLGHFFENIKLFKYAVKFDLLTPSEMELLNILRKKNFKKIIIHNTISDNIIIEKTQTIDLKGEAAKNLRKTLGLKQYEKAEIFYRNDKHLVVKNIVKQHIQS